MIIKHIKYFRYDIPLLSPLYINKVKTTKRSGFIIRLKDSEQNTGFGEIAPLPGLHSENLQTVVNLFDDIEKQLPGNSISEYAVISGQYVSDILKINTLPPVIQFGVSMAVLDLLANSKKMPLNKLYQTEYNNNVPVNGLLTGPPEEILTNAEKLRSQGYVTLKIKVGRQAVDDDISLVQKVRQLCGDQTRLRLDANRAWELAEALRFAQGIAQTRIEYIEEPLRDPAELPEFSKTSGLPVALDESLFRFYSPGGTLPDWAGAVVLKPSVIGDINKTVQIINQAKTQKIAPVLSSAFDSGLTLRTLALLSSVFIPEEIAMGLNTYQWFSQDLLTKPFKADLGKIDIKRMLNTHINLHAPVLAPIKR